MNNVASNFVGSVPKFYESGLVPVLFEDYAEDLANRVIKCKPSKVLELASGTGVVTRLLRSGLASDCELIASDLNEPMLDVAKAKFKSGEAVSFRAVDAMNIPLEDASVDVVTCQFGVMFFPDKVKSFKEALRVLKPGGHYTFNVWDSLENNPFAAIAQSVCETEFPDDPPGFYKVPFHYHDARVMKKEMKAAGFSTVKVKRKRLSKKVKSLEDFATSLVHGNPLAEEVLARDGDPDVIVEKFLAAFKTRFPKDKMPLSAFIVTGVK
jgi:ubiquinone/menaquinone biosynthesis C-methylase UbiE